MRETSQQKPTKTTSTARTKIPSAPSILNTNIDDIGTSDAHEIEQYQYVQLTTLIPTHTLIFFFFSIPYLDLSNSI